MTFDCEVDEQPAPVPAWTALGPKRLRQHRGALGEPGRPAGHTLPGSTARAELWAPKVPWMLRGLVWGHRGTGGEETNGGYVTICVCQDSQS